MSNSADLLETIELSDGHKVLIFPDTEAESPREWDNLGSMMCAHGKYKLGDEDQEVFEDAESWQDNLEMIKEQLGEQLISLPLYLYDHSGITMNTEGFSDHWDSGQVGFIYIPVSKALAELGSGSAELDDEIREKVLEALKDEVKTYDSYLRGDVFRFELQNPEGDQIESCSGFYSVEDAEQAAAEMVPGSEQ